MIYDFYSTGSDDQLTLIDNQQAFRRIKLRPKILIDVSSQSAVNSISCQTQLLNSTITISFPCIIAPTALHRLANNEHGELATVRAAVACSTIMCVSTMASICMERIAEEHREQIKANYPRSIMHPDDAREAVKHGVEGIIVSNHGGRQLDTCQSTIDALPDIMNAISSELHQIDVYIDGGVRRGTDILKAVALGAKAVLIGRPVLWGLAEDGMQGIKNVLDILKKEFRLAMMLCGCQTVDDIRRNNLLVINNNNNTQSKL
ncbi:unnamed protein product [Rotaria sp. Silwood2]|nr:unnamed protein product [Rotaria sp. Silwood2]